MEHLSHCTRQYRELLLKDDYRPAYHFAFPDDNGVPGDSNGAFYADGRYHLMYLYRNTTAQAYHWGHVSSTDLLHWRHHPDALAAEDGDEGCFSGGAFVDSDGTAYLTFWKFAARDETVDKTASPWPAQSRPTMSGSGCTPLPSMPIAGAFWTSRRRER